jgi:DNA-directed RNA polymerase specialized sigma24 family protein
MDVPFRTETMEERELIGMAREGDQDAFGKLFLAHHSAIFRSARATLGDSAEDVASETFVRAWTALPKYRRHHRVRGRPTEFLHPRRPRVDNGRR